MAEVKKYHAVVDFDVVYLTMPNRKPIDMCYLFSSACECVCGSEWDSAGD